MKDFDKAVLYCRKALRFEPGNSWYHVLAAFVCGKRGDVPQAIRHWEEAARLDPGDTQYPVEVSNMRDCIADYFEEHPKKNIPDKGGMTMSSKHHLHEEIGKWLDELKTGPERIKEISIKKDKACCRNGENIRLFCNAISSEKARGNTYCNVDLLIKRQGEISVIIEIEESDIKPTQILGKFLTSALASYYCPKGRQSRKVLKADKVLFIQILKKSKVSKDKEDQLKNIEKSINVLIKNPITRELTRIVKYKTYITNEKDAGKGKLLKDIREFLEK